MVAPERPQFVLFGSSIVEMSFGAGLGVAGWGAILADLYARQADIVLRGYGGWNSKRGLEIIEQVFPKDAAVQPCLVIVYFGGNDSVDPHPSGLGPHVPLDEFVENMRKIATYLMSLSEKTRLIFLTTPPFHEEQYRRVQEFLGNNNRISGRSNEACRVYSEACMKLCQEMGIKVIDLWTEIQKKNDWQTTCFIDGIHFSSEGSKIVAKEILKVLRDANWEPSLYLTSLPSEFAEDSPYDPVNIDGITTINQSKRWVKTSFFSELSNHN